MQLPYGHSHRCSQTWCDKKGKELKKSVPGQSVRLLASLAVLLYKMPCLSGDDDEPNRRKKERILDAIRRSLMHCMARAQGVFHANPNAMEAQHFMVRGAREFLRAALIGTTDIFIIICIQLVRYQI